MNGILLDTTILIDLSRGNIQAASFIDQKHDAKTPLFISVISAMELIYGCLNKAEVEQIKLLIADFTVLPLSPVDSAKAYELMVTFSKSHNLAIPDALIAATALNHKLELATDNIRHFRMIPDLELSKPY